MRRHDLQMAVLVSVAAALAGCDLPAMGPRARETVLETRRLDAEGAFRLENTNGAVLIETWKEPSVRIEAEKAGSPWALERMRVEIRGEGDRVEVTSRQPRRWLFGGAARIEYRVTVPERARLEVETTNGHVRVRGTAGAVRVRTTNGGVEVEDASGTVEASTTNGSIRAAFRDSPGDGSNRFSTTNGSVTVTLPAQASGEFEASTVNGAIQTDFPLQVEGGFGGRRLRGRLGEARAHFEARTVNGSVRFRKAAS